MSSSSESITSCDVTPPAQLFTIVVFCLGALITPFLGLLVYLIFVAILLYTSRAVQKLDKERGRNVLPAYMQALLKVCYRFAVSFITVLGVTIYMFQDVFETTGTAPSELSVLMVVLTSVVILMHVVLIGRIVWSAMRGRESPNYCYLSLLTGGFAIVRTVVGRGRK